MTHFTASLIVKMLCDSWYIDLIQATTMSKIWFQRQLICALECRTTGGRGRPLLQPIVIYEMSSLLLGYCIYMTLSGLNKSTWQLIIHTPTLLEKYKRNFNWKMLTSRKLLGSLRKFTSFVITWLLAEEWSEGRKYRFVKSFAQVRQSVFK